MNVLLVDDEMDVLEGITDALDFDSLGIESVYLGAKRRSCQRNFVEP